ncbi:MAG TPA: metal-dependent hydrolase [Ignavibacteriaceae bacterium]|nr:metal-dependent hydrolase [Ignavibacteriaceae bacterium]
MFIGHFGVGLAAKKIDNKPSLGTFFFASQFIDLLWPFFLLLGIEKVNVVPGISAFTPLDFTYYPFSHSLLGVLFWSILFGIFYFLLKKNFKSAVILGLLVLSHWILDLITHIPDLPLFPGNEIKVGLGLWNSIPLTIVVEGLIFISGSYLYIKATKAVNKKGNATLWSLLIFLVVVYIMNIFGPPPDSAEAIGYVGLSQWLLIAWGYWIDRNRTSVSKIIS